ncbi:MAG: recombinase family protein [Oscillospiraceae bacterium]|nr:recombinase family protein [Oscillospiraceae bacterium]
MSSSTENPMQALAASMTPKFAVSYLRVSTRGQAERGGGADEGFSIPAQREANKKKALSMGAIVGKEFVDRGASAKSADRPELQKMLEYVKENTDRVDYVIVHKVDRLARNRGDDIDIMRTLRECGVQLVSASESIDDTPAGMLLHGIMSSIAEFYSQNLANEVKKGINEKVKNGGTVSRAPIGYTNIRRIDEKGREERTVILDEERAPLIRLAFEEYATGNWTIEDLAEHLAACGLTTRATPKIPSSPIDKRALNTVLVNPYYKGIVTYKGVAYQGNHPSIIDDETWQRVQDVLSSHYNGERTREHPHFLKGSLYCRSCGSRMIITYAKSRSGVRYPYFICIGRHNKAKDCKQKAVLIDEIERQVEEIYDRYSLPADIREYLGKWFQNYIKDEKERSGAQLGGLHREKHKLEHQRKKLLEAHYYDAIPLELLKSEQQKIAKQLAAIEHEIKAHEHTFDATQKRLADALDLVEDCGRTYRLADAHIKRMLNQALFSKLWVNEDGQVSAEFTEPFQTLVAFAEEEVARHNEKEIRSATQALTDFFSVISNRLQKFFDDGLNNNFMVEISGIEPLTS